MKSIKMNTKNKQRIQAILEKGDIVGALVFTGHRSGFSGRVKVTAIHHWGVYAVLRGKDLDYYCKNYKQEYKDKIGKRQFKIKWCHIDNIELL
ncbi:hypothetical protein CVD28_03635 [Bacillus sp. M6-12]|uniref:hypothetical protein n=1 Tax=Bacillus sp. M6-12 TaxID=2054166 RepID=UPI000C75D492|nr:hypothetical protein [Bacillus sp. M6-12]PLS19519.1 hypothetical protein CVD28_03635 [Bacillus sp. M6-12]